jgi:hypothetical protein
MALTRKEVLADLDSWNETGEPVDALCEAAEYLGWDEGEYQYEDLLRAVQASGDKAE